VNFWRVVEEVAHRAGEAVGVAHGVDGQRGDVRGEAEALALEGGAAGLDGAARDGGEVVARVDEAHAPGLELRHVEERVDGAAEAGEGLVHRGDGALLRGGERAELAPLEEAHVPDERRQRRRELVRHVAVELPAQPVGLHQLRVGVGELVHLGLEVRGDAAPLRAQGPRALRRPLVVGGLGGVSRWPPRKESTVRAKVRASMGLPRKPSQPTAREVARSPSAVMATMGTPGIRPRRRSATS
jgi:hypothetical protein